MTKPTRFILPRRLDPEPLIIPGATLHMAGYFKIEAIRPDGRRRLVADWQPNLITNAGLDLYAMTNRDTYVNHNWKWLRYCSLGTGSAEPQFTDNSLDTFLAEAYYISGDSQNEQFTVEPYYKWFKRKYRFAQGVATGTITEIGIGQQLSKGGQLTTRALIRDTNGDPTFIIITADEQVDITYEFRCYVPDLNFYDTQGLINGILYDIKSGPANVDSEAQNWDRGQNISGYGYEDPGTPNIGTVFTEPTDSFGGNRTIALESYTYGSYTRTMSTTWGYTEWPQKGAGATAFVLKGITHWQFAFTQNLNTAMGIPHDNTTSLFMRFRETWDRYTPP